MTPEPEPPAVERTHDDGPIVITGDLLAVLFGDAEP